MKILHLASFTGNIGDQASHYGTYNLLKRYMYLETTQLELRRFYKIYHLPDRLEFDEEFVRTVNDYDLLLVGGGGYLDYFLDSSSNGTTLDISPEILSRITTPILMCSIGCLPRGGDHNFPKAREFLDLLKTKATVLLRNDGSHKRFPDFPHVADSGIFYCNDGDYKPTENYIAVNVSADLLGDPETLINEMVVFVNTVNERIVFVPHIYSDLRVIHAILDRLHYWTIATRITVAPYMQGEEGSKQLFSVYKNSEQVVACRFHANLCSIAMGKPCVGIGVSEKVMELYRLFGKEAVAVSEGFGRTLSDRFGEIYDPSKQRDDTIAVYDREIINILGAG